MRGALEADKQSAKRGFDVGTCRTHHIINNAGATTVTVVQMHWKTCLSSVRDACD